MAITHKWNGTILEITSDSGTSAADLKGAKGDTGARGARGLQGERGGGAAIEDGIISSETTWSSAAIMDNFAESMSVSGNPVSCEPIPNYPLHIITGFDAKQSGSGNPYPKGGGKNQIPYPYFNKSQTVNGIVYTINNDGSVTANGTPNNAETNSNMSLYTGTYAHSATMFSLKAGNWKLVCEGSKDNWNFYIILYKRTSETTFEAVTSTRRGSIANFTTTEESNKYYLLIACQPGYAPTNETLKFMIVAENETDLTYEPYSNIRPIAGYDAINVVRCGKNIFNFDDWKIDNGIKGGSAAWGNNSITLTATENDCYTSYALETHYTIRLKENNTYTLTWELGSNAAAGKVIVFFYNDELYTGTGYGYKTIENSEKEYTFTVPNEAPYIRVRVGVDSKGGVAEYKNIQLEESATATAFELYNGNTFTMALGSTYYNGSIDWNRGAMIVNKAGLKLTGNEMWYEDDNWHNTSAYYTASALMGDAVAVEGYDTIANIICSHATVTTPNNIANNNKIGVAQGGSGTTLYMCLGEYSTIEEFKAYLAAQETAGTPVIVLYDLAEPQTIELTAQEIRAIKGINTLYTNADNLQVIGRVDTMKQLSDLAARVAALEAALNGGE